MFSISYIYIVYFINYFHGFPTFPQLPGIGVSHEAHDYHEPASVVFGPPRHPHHCCLIHRSCSTTVILFRKFTWRRCCCWCCCCCCCCWVVPHSTAAGGQSSLSYMAWYVGVGGVGWGAITFIALNTCVMLRNWHSLVCWGGTAAEKHSSIQHTRYYCWFLDQIQLFDKNEKMNFGRFWQANLHLQTLFTMVGTSNRNVLNPKQS